MALPAQPPNTADAPAPTSTPAAPGSRPGATTLLLLAATGTDTEHLLREARRHTTPTATLLRLPTPARQR